MAHEPPDGFPRRVKVARRIFKIDYVPRDHHGVKDGDSYCLGTCISSDDQIYIVTAQSEASMRNVVLHEIAHAAYAHAGMGGEEPDGDEEERIICWVTDLLLGLEESGLIRVTF